MIRRRTTFPYPSRAGTGNTRDIVVAVSGARTFSRPRSVYRDPIDDCSRARAPARKRFRTPLEGTANARDITVGVPGTSTFPYTRTYTGVIPR